MLCQLTKNRIQSQSYRTISNWHKLSHSPNSMKPSHSPKSMKRIVVSSCQDFQKLQTKLKCCKYCLVAKSSPTVQSTQLTLDRRTWLWGVLAWLRALIQWQCKIQVICEPNYRWACKIRKDSNPKRFSKSTSQNQRNKSGILVLSWLPRLRVLLASIQFLLIVLHQGRLLLIQDPALSE